MRVCIAATHPIQYQVPWFQALARRPELDLEVAYAWIPDRSAQGTGFGVAFDWDVPLLEGYRWVELERAGGRPDLDRFASLKLRRPGHWLGGAGALIVTGWHRLPLIQLAFAAGRRDVALLARGDSPGDRPRGRLRRLLLALWLRRFAAFLVVGRANRSFYRGLGVPESKLFDCPHHVDHSRFEREAAVARGRRADVRARWGVAEGDVAVLFCGKLIPEKNVAELLEGFAKASEEEPRLRLVLIGDGPLRGELERGAAALGLAPSWDGFRNQGELPEVYAAADLLVLPSRSETWGLVVNEAFACGLPVVASDRVGCVPDLVHPGRTGEVYPSGSPAELAARLVRLARDSELRRAEGAAGRELAASNYSVDCAVEGTLAALAALASAT